ncbi:MAG: MOSC domain-containing protein [Beijerinckiaceae bacterium]
MTLPAQAAVATAWRYPVKSMMGEELNAAVLTERGVLGDRAYALVDDETGIVVSAKNPQKWPDFFACRAAYVAPPEHGAVPPVWITLPDGQVVRSDEAGVSAEVSKALSRKVSLARVAPEKAALEQFWPGQPGEAGEVTAEAIAGDAPAGSFFDYATVHVLTTATLDALRAHYPEGRFEARRFRPNIVIDTGDAKGFVENDWVGKTLEIGETLRLEVTDPCARCVMTTLAQGDLPRDPGIFRQAIAKNRVFVPFAGKVLPSVGVYAKVITGGTLRRGDAVRVV